MSKCYLQGLGEGYGRLPDRTDALPTGLPECATARPAGETSKDVGHSSGEKREPEYRYRYGYLKKRTVVESCLRVGSPPDTQWSTGSSRPSGRANPTT